MTLSREFSADLEIRSDGTGRTIHGIVVPFGVAARVRDGAGPPYEEEFQQGAFTKTLTERRSPVRLLSQHDTGKPIGLATEMRQDTAGLYGAFKLSNTREANDQLELARDGVLDSFSIGFSPVKHVKRGPVTVRTEVALRETSLVTFPAYEGALVAGIRHLNETDIEAARSALVAAGIDADLVNDLLDEQDSLTSFAQRLDAALAAKAGTPSLGAVSSEPPIGHSGRLVIARNVFRAALTERGLRP